jgi:hypothetical protein
MLNSARILLLPVLLFTALSCSDSENEVPDTSGPVITIVSPAENAKLKGTLTITAKAEDLSDDVSMEIFVDSNPLKKETTKEITAQTDTKLLAEGAHTIKVVATDKEGNVTTKSIAIEVRNVLFKLHTNATYVPPGFTIYYVLSKNDGSTMAVHKAENNTTFTFDTPGDFNPDSSFVYSAYFYSYTPGVPSTTGFLLKQVNSYAGITAGEFSLPVDFIYGPKVGDHHLEITDIPEPVEGKIEGEFTGSLSGFWGLTDVITADIPLRNSSSDLLCVLTPESDKTPKFKYLNTILPNQSTEISFNDFTAMDKRTVPLNSAAGDYRIFIHGFKNDSDRGMQILGNLGTSAESYLDLYYPGNTYPKYLFDFSIENYGNVVFGATPPTTFKYLNAEVKKLSYSSRRLTVTTTGDFDRVTVNAGGGEFNSAENQSEIIGYSVSFPAGANHKVVLPETPQELAHAQFPAPDQFTFTSSFLEDYTAMSGAEDYQQRIVFSSDGKYLSMRDRIYRDVDLVTGGRSASSKVNLPAKFQFLKRYAPGITR